MVGNNYICRECTVKDLCSESCAYYHMTDTDLFYQSLQADLYQPSGTEWIYDNYRPGEYRGNGGVWGQVW